jgi:hypothetical protein
VGERSARQEIGIAEAPRCFGGAHARGPSTCKVAEAHSGLPEGEAQLGAAPRVSRVVQRRDGALDQRQRVLVRVLEPQRTRCARYALEDTDASEGGMVGDLRPRWTVRAFQNLGDGRVERASARPGDVAVERVPQERVRESKSSTFATVENAGAPGCLDRLRDLVAIPPGDADDRGLVPLHADDGRDVEQLQRSIA